MTSAESALVPADVLEIPSLPSDRPRALEPSAAGYVERDGATVWWEAFGPPGAPAVHLLPPWGLVHSRAWNHLVPGLARHLRVIVSDAPGSGRSGPAREPRRHTAEAIARDCLAVMDAARVERTLLVGHSRGAQWGLWLAAHHPERVSGAVLIAPFLPVTPSWFPWLLTHPALRRGFDGPVSANVGWGRMNAGAWRRDLRGFATWFSRHAVSAPHSELVVEEAADYACDADVESLIAGAKAPMLRGRREAGALADRVACPVTVVHGAADRIAPRGDAAWLAQRTGGRLVALPGADHTPQARDPIAIHEEILAAAGVRRTSPPLRPSRRRQRALFLSSPIGLGHVKRDLAIARELRTLVGHLDVVWLTQHPAAAFLEREGETVHPASRELHSECRVLEDAADGRRLDLFGAFTRADAVLTANYHVIREVAQAEEYDLWIGDEAWELDHFLHEHPADKRAPYVWLTDYVGLLPTERDGPRRRELIADRNALALAQRRRHPGVRDLSLFVGDPEDCVTERFGRGLPRIDEWTREHFSFTGHIGERPVPSDRAVLGWQDAETVCVAAVGGTSVGGWLLQEFAAAHLPGIRKVVVCGPRVDPRSLPPGVEVHGFVADLPGMLAAADVAVVQGGLATTMELACAGTPFVYAPIDGHFEQQIHVAHRLARHGVGVRLDGDFPGAVREALDRGARPLALPGDGARRAAQWIAELL